MEYNNDIRVIAKESTIFRGHVVSYLSVHVTVHQRFTSQDKKNPRYCLSARLEKVDDMSNVTSILSSSQEANMTFQKNATGNDPSKCIIFDDRQIVLDCHLQHNLFKSNEKFRITVAACLHQEKEEEAYGVSQEIT